jgi:periplasmic mercuric ion binding protein
MKKLNGVIITAFALMFFAVSVYAENTEIKIKTSAMCAHCKTSIEKTLKKVKGVKAAKLNLDDKVVTVKYNTDKTNPDALRNSIAKLGYDADNVKAEEPHKCDMEKGAKKAACCPKDKKTCAPDSKCCPKVKKDAKTKKDAETK